MGIQVCVKLSVAAAALLLGWSAAHAVPLEQWANRAMDLRRAKAVEVVRPGSKAG
jgi:hypothetical protein